jgi:signal transduction protein with GAF and PtsI domain
MERVNVNYDTLVRITKSISTIRDPEEIVLVTVEGVKHALKVKGCALFLFSPGKEELELAGSFGLSKEYLNKGPVSALKSMAESLQDLQPIAIYDVTDDPRIQYPEAAKKEGIASILSVPIIIGNNLLGSMRVYTATPWERPRKECASCTPSIWDLAWFSGCRYWISALCSPGTFRLPSRPPGRRPGRN